MLQREARSGNSTLDTTTAAVCTAVCIIAKQSVNSALEKSKAAQSVCFNRIGYLVFGFVLQHISWERASQLCLNCWIFGAVLILNALSPQHPAHAQCTPFLGWCDKYTKTQIRCSHNPYKSSSSYKSSISSALLLFIEMPFLMLAMSVCNDGRQLDELV